MFGIESQDWHAVLLLGDIEQLNTGYIRFIGSFWDQVAPAGAGSNIRPSVPRQSKARSLCAH